MTDEQLREIDTLISNHIMGKLGRLPEYSKDISKAWLVVEKCSEKGFFGVPVQVSGPIFNLHRDAIGDWECMIGDVGPGFDFDSAGAKARTAALAICLAALKAKVAALKAKGVAI